MLSHVDTRRCMPILLLVGWLCVDGVLAIVGWVCGVELAKSCLFLLAWGQFIAATGWIAAGENGSKTTLIVVVGGTCGVALAVAIAKNDPSLLGLLWVLPYAMLLNLPLAVARALGWSFRLDGSTAHVTAHVTVRAYQVSIRDIMICTAIVAFVASFWSFTAPPNPPTPAPPSTASSAGSTSAQGQIITVDLGQIIGEAIRTILVVGALLAFPIPWSIWAILCTLRPLQAALMAGAVLFLWGVLLLRAVGELSAWPLAAMGFALIPAEVLLLHMFTLLMSGYRWQRRVGPIPVRPRIQG